MKKSVLFLSSFLAFAVIVSSLQAQDLLKVSVVNNSDDYTDDQVYVQMIGLDAAGSGKYGHVDLDTSTWTEISESDNTVDPPGGPWARKYTGYAKKLTDLTSEGPHTWSFQMPRIISGRVYISFEQPTYFHINPGPALEFPSAVNDALPNYTIIFDKVELDWQNAALPFMNTTNVDFFSIAFKMELKGSGGSLGTAGFNKTRKAIMDELCALPSIWQNGIIPPPDPTPAPTPATRFVTPHKLDDITLCKDYFNDYVSICWSYYTPNTLAMQNLPDDPAMTATGQVAGNVFTFTVTSGGDTGEVVTINNLNGQSQHIFGCDGPGYLFTTGSDSKSKQSIIKQMGAALNRSVLFNIQTSSTWWSDPSKFYTQELTNHYSGILHDAAYNGFCYGFPYDDVGKYDTGISGDATEAIITIQSMSGGLTPTPTGPTPTPLPVVPLALMKNENGDYTLYGYNVPVAGDWTYWDAAARNPSPLARDLWLIPSGNNTVAMTEVDANAAGEQELAVLKAKSGFDYNIYLYNGPVPGDWAYWDAVSRNPSPLARDFWMIPSGNDTVIIADGGSRIASMKNPGGDYNLYLYKSPAPGDWIYWDAAARNPSPLARDFWVIPGGNDTVAMCGLDTIGDGDVDSLQVVRNQGGDYSVYLWNMLAPGDWTYWDAIARNPSARAKDLWVVPARNDIAQVVGVGRDSSPDELVVMENNGGDYNFYIWNTPVTGDWVYWDAVSRNPSPLVRDFWMTPSGNDTVDLAAP